MKRGMEATGPPVDITEGRMARPDWVPREFAFSTQGSLAYVPRDELFTTQRLLVRVGQD